MAQQMPGFSGRNALAAAGLVTTCLILAGTPATASTVLPKFSDAVFQPGAAIDNPYFPLAKGYRVTMRANGVDDENNPFTEESQLAYGGLGPVILGVQTTVQRDFAFEDDRLVEDTYDYYAQDSVGNVWYLGEDVTNYVYDDDGKLIETNNSSAWIAGKNGALPGYIMPANPVVGLAYYQEFAANDGALDEALILATDLSFEIGGTIFEDVLAIYETTALHPDAREAKYFAPNIG
ncbi:MAG: hypothetical protein WBN04_11095, partial [Paracoccaceae bacterium]